MELIRHADTNTEMVPVNGMTGGSTTSEACAAAIIKACQDLKNSFKLHPNPESLILKL